MTSWHAIPGSDRLVVDASAGRRGRLVRTLSGASDWRRDLAERTGIGLLELIGPARLATAERPTWPSATWDEVAQRLSDVLPGIRLVGAVIPRQRGRRRLSIVAHMTGNTVVVKLSGDADPLIREGEALDLLSHRPLPSISTPLALDRGTIDVDDGASVAYLVTTAIALGRQRAAIDEPLRTFEADVRERLGELPVIHGSTGAEMVPVHGDLTPWNLRRTPRGLALFDWESAGWGRPGSDLDSYRAACDLVRRPWTSGRRRSRSEVRR